MDETNEGIEANEASERRISRRRLIKTVGAGTAIAWAAPTVVGLGGTAMAAGSAVQPVRCDGCDPADPCAGQSPCGDPQFGCSCKPPQVGAGNPCICTGNGSCSQFDACPGGQGDCPAGFTCTSSCCDLFDFDRLCLPNCGTQAVAARVAGGGPRTDGK